MYAVPLQVTEPPTLVVGHDTFDKTMLAVGVAPVAVSVRLDGLGVPRAGAISAKLAVRVPTALGKKVTEM